MTTNKLRRGIAVALCVAFVALLAIGGINLPKKDQAVGQSIVNDMRTQALLNATGDGVVESYVNIAKKEAQEKAKAEKAGMAAKKQKTISRGRPMTSIAFLNFSLVIRHYLLR